MQAAIASMRNLVGAVIATSLVLMAVFVPVGFFPGTAAAALPAVCVDDCLCDRHFLLSMPSPLPRRSPALLLRAQPRQTGALGWIYRRINGFLTGLERSYHWGLGRLMRWQSAVLVGFVGLLVATGWLYTQVPQAFLPEEDQGYFHQHFAGARWHLPQLHRAGGGPGRAAVAGGAGARGHLCHGRGGLQRQHPQPGHSVCAAQNPGRSGRQPEQSVTGILNRVRMPLMGIPQAPVIAVNPPTIPQPGQRRAALCSSFRTATAAPQTLTNWTRTERGDFGEGQPDPRLARGV